MNPNWPHGFSSWYDLGLLTMLCLFKLDRGRTMLRRSRFIDRLGASFIASDFAIGFAYGVAIAFTLFPSLVTDGWLRWGVRTVVTLVLGTAWLLMRMANPARVQKAVGDRGRSPA